MFDQLIIKPLCHNFDRFSNQKAFCFNSIYYSYSDLYRCVLKIRKNLQDHNHQSKNIGVVANDDLETYSSIFAIWLEGLAYVPLDPSNPIERNSKIIKQAVLHLVLDSSEKSLFVTSKVVKTSDLSNQSKELKPVNALGSDLAYILFTSGTTGEPKGVPITRGNLAAFVKSFNELGFELGSKDKFLQMFDLTFDLSVMSYLIPILKGSCAFTIPKDRIKYGYIYELLEDHNISFALMVPSILQYLRPYFEEMNFPHLKYNLFCGEALPLDVTEEWSKCIPNAEILNVYGPTENTIFCTFYKYDLFHKKTHNGILAIGKDMEHNKSIIIDVNNKILNNGNLGELCLSGEQLTPGYWNNEQKNSETFFTKYQKGKRERFYKTGDLCSIDEEGELLYHGRIDSQTKIQGFRVELSEIEFHAKNFLNKLIVVATDFKNKIGNNEIGLAIESHEFDTNELLAYLKNKIPGYMIPTQIRFVSVFPLNVNGKIDRKKIKKIFIL